MSDEKEREFITKDRALELIGDRETVHVFLNPSASMLIGADWSLGDIKNILDKAETIEIGGEQCKAMKHPIVALHGGKYHFIEANLAEEIGK